MNIQPRITAYLKAPDPECFNLCKLYCLIMIVDPLALFLCIAGCIALCTD